MTSYPPPPQTGKRCSCCWRLSIRADAKRRKCQQCRDARCRRPNCSVVSDRRIHPGSITPSDWRTMHRRARSAQVALDAAMIEPSPPLQPTLFDLPPERRRH